MMYHRRDPRLQPEVLVRFYRWLIPALLLLLAGALATGCGSSESGGPPDLSTIRTATPPQVLPDVQIIGESDAPLGGSTYTVQAGDSPSTIADQFGVSVEELMSVNGITDPTALVPGQELTIPGSRPPDDSDVLGATAVPTSTPAPAEPTEEPAPSADGQVYVVQEGDIPETIAAQFGITAEELMAANGITDPTSLQVGDELVIPAPSG